MFIPLCLLTLMISVELTMCHWGHVEDCNEVKRLEIDQCRSNITHSSPIPKSEFGKEFDSNDITVMTDHFYSFMKICRTVEKRKRCDQLYTECNPSQDQRDSTTLNKLTKKICHPEFRKKLECIYIQASQESVSKSCAEMSDAKIRASHIEGNSFSDIENEEFCMSVNVYLMCMREPIELQCGPESWNNFKDVMFIMAEFVPNCNPDRSRTNTISASAVITPQRFLIVLLSILFSTLRAYQLPASRR